MQAAIDAFLAKFPEGTYEFEGKTIDGEALEGEAELSWDLPTPVEILDPESSFPVIAWTPSVGVAVIGYEIVYVQSTDVPASIRSIETSPEFVRMVERSESDGSLLEFKVEVLATAANGNKTITEATILEADE